MIAVERLGRIGRLLRSLEVPIRFDIAPDFKHRQRRTRRSFFFVAALAQEIGVEIELIGALAQKSDLFLQRRDEVAVVVEISLEAAILGEHLEHVRGGEIGTRPQIGEVVTLHRPAAQQPMVEQRLIRQPADIVGQPTHQRALLAEDVRPTFQETLDETIDQQLRSHHPSDAAVGVEILQQQRAFTNDANEMSQLAIVEDAVGRDSLRGLTETIGDRPRIERFDTHVPSAVCPCPEDGAAATNMQFPRFFSFGATLTPLYANPIVLALARSECQAILANRSK